MNGQIANRRAAVACLLLSTGFTGDSLAAQTLGTAFTYQGQLKESGQPASGLYDLQTCLFDTPTNPIPMACAPDFADVPVEAGLFAITLDFGSAPFVGQQRFLELRVRPGASVSGYTILAPRQVIRPAPEALRSNVAAAAPWSGLTGVPAGFADGVDQDSGGTVTSVATGTGLTGGPISGSGTIGIATGGVGLNQVASNAVDTSRIVDGSVAAADVDATQVQRRVTGSCPPGQFVRVVAQDGTVVCQADSNGGGTVTSVGSGAGLTGGPITGSGSLAIANGGVATVMIAPGAVGTSQLASNAVTSAQIAAGAVGSGQIAVGAVGNNQINASQVQLRVTGTCQAGEYMRGVNFNGSVICQPLSETLPTLNDTGINDCANGGTFASCPLANFPDQDGDYGRDARSRVGLVARFGGGEFGFDYNKISNSGNVVSASAALGTGATDWGCTRDNVSGLIWEVKLNNIASLRHMDHTYTWYDTNTTINGGNAGTVGTASTCNSTLSQCNTSAFVAAVNAQGLCGASNWRLPTREELQGILHYGRINPAIDPGYFPNTSASNNSATEWSGRNFAADASYAWVIDFYRGVVANQVKSRDSGVRLVRGVP